MLLPQFSQQGAASELYAVQTTDNRNGVSNGWQVVGKFSVETDKIMDEWKVNVVRLAEDHLAPVIARGRSVRTERTE